MLVCITQMPTAGPGRMQGLDTAEKGAPDECTLVLDAALCDALYKGVSTARACQSL